MTVKEIRKQNNRNERNTKLKYYPYEIRNGRQIFLISFLAWTCLNIEATFSLEGKESAWSVEILSFTELR